MPLPKRYERLDNFQRIWKARDKERNEVVAVKRIESDTEHGMSNRTMREVSILRQLSHPNIVTLYDVTAGSDDLYVSYEWVDLDLKTSYDTFEGPLPPELIKSYACQLLSGLEYCHTQCIFHRDLTSWNLLVSHDGRLKIAGFSLARSITPPVSRPFTPGMVTLWYRPPEILLGSEFYGFSVDMWAVGIIIGELVIKQPVFRGNSEIDELFKIFRSLGTPTEEVFPGISSLPFFKHNFPVWQPLKLSHIFPGMCETGLDLIDKLLPFDPRLRLTARAALEHPYFDGMI